MICLQEIISGQVQLASKLSWNQDPTQTPVFFLILNVQQNNLNQMEEETAITFVSNSQF